jgi:2'-5' RNA ligase
VRLFFALTFDPAEASKIARLACEASKDPRRRVTPLNNLHLTVLFLGNSSADLLPQLFVAARLACANVASFPLHLHQRELFVSGRTRRPTQIEALVPDEPSRASLQHLFDELTRALRGISRIANAHPLGQRPFRPHITIARTRSDPPCRTPPTAPQLINLSLSRVRYLSLIESKTMPAGAQYRCVERFALACGPSQSR